MASEGLMATAVPMRVALEPLNVEGTLLSPRLTEVMTEAISDGVSRAMLSSTVLRGKTVEEICYEQGIPQSSCYRRMRRLIEEGAMVVERMVIASTGRKYAVYRSAFSRLDITLENGVVSAYATMNPDVAHKLRHTHRAPESSSSSHQKLSPFVMHRGGGPQAVAASP
jgi:predicted transcriptional regulator